MNRILRMSDRTEQTIARYHHERRERFNRLLTPWLLAIAGVGLMLLALAIRNYS